MYLFIFESLGTSELILIGIVALIFLGPRRLPEIARKVGKMMADLRSTANDFKSTWEKEVDLEEEAKALRIDNLLDEEDDKPVARETPVTIEGEVETAAVEIPAIRAMNKEEFEALSSGTAENPPSNGHHSKEDHGERSKPEEPDLLSDKRNWL